MITAEEIFDGENLLYEAMKLGSTDMLDEILHDDLLFVAPNGQVLTKEIDIDTYRSGLLKINELLPDVENVNIIEDTAVVTLKVHLKGKFEGLPFEASYRYIRFWKKNKDGLKVIGGSGIAI